MQTEFAVAPGISPNKLDRSESQENVSPNGTLSIKAWHGAQPTRIPSPMAAKEMGTPADKMVKNKGLFASPLPTPMACTREDSLRVMEQQLDSKLSQERKAQTAVLRRLDAAGPSASEASNALKDEASKRSARIFVLSQKLTRTRRTLASLQTAQAEYHTSAKKVQIVEAKLQAKTRATPRLSSSDTSKLRHELDEATSMMGAAFRRVEQIETITDTLIQQLADTEAELAELHHIRDEEIAAHADEVRLLESERAVLQRELNAAAAKAAELAAEDAVLKTQLASASKRAGKLASAVETADKAKSEAEQRMNAERATLAATLQGLRATQQELAADLNAKEAQLEEALQRANQGTPVGQGAKVVLPMALRRIKETQKALREEESRASAAHAELERVSAEAAAREASLKLKLQELDAERQRQVSEKQASLESMTRAAAGAAKEAAVKQEAVNKLASEITSLDKERTDLQSELQDATHRCLEVEAQLAELQVQLNEVCSEREEAQASASSLHEQLSAAIAERSELSSALEANSAHAAALEASITEIKQQMQNSAATHFEETEALRTALAAAEALTADVKLQLAEASVAQGAVIRERAQLEKKLKHQEDSVAKLKDAVSGGKARIAELEGELSSANDNAAAQKVQLFQALQSMESQLHAAVIERDTFEMQLIDSETQCSAHERSVAALRAQLSAAEETHLARVGELAAALEAGEARMAAATEYMEAAAAAQAAMEASVSGLQSKIDGLEGENADARDALAALQASSAASSEKLHVMLQEAITSQMNLNQEKKALEVQMQQQEVSIADLTAAFNGRTLEVAALESRVVELQEAAAERFAMLSNQLQIVCDERDQLDREREKLTGDLDRLAEALQVREAEVSAARAQGTPKGEASKQVLRLSFAKIKALQEAEKDAKVALEAKTAAVAERDAAIADLEAAICNREELNAALQHRMILAVEAAEAQSAALEKELGAEREAVEELSKVNAALAPQVEALSAELEAAAVTEAAMEAAQAKQAQQLSSVESELKKSVAALEDALKTRNDLSQEKAAIETRAAKTQAMLDAAHAESQRKEASSKTVLTLSFQKIRGLEASLERQSEAIQGLEVQLECAEDNASQLAEDLAVKAAALAAAERLASRVPGLEQDNASLERAMCRLRVDVQQELVARQAAEAERDVAAKEVSRLEALAAKLREESASLQETARRAEQATCTAEAALEVALKEKSDGIQAAVVERDAALAAQAAAEAAAGMSNGKVKAALAALENMRYESAQKEKAAKEVSKRAFEKIKALERAVEDHEGQMALAAARAVSLELQLEDAQNLLAEAKKDASVNSAAVIKAESQVTKQTKAAEALSADLCQASKQITNLEGALAAARAEVSELAAQRSAAATKSAATIGTLQASSKGGLLLLTLVHFLYLAVGILAQVAELQVQLTASQKEADASRVDAATLRGALQQALASSNAQASHLEQTEAQRKALQEECGELAAKVASLANELSQRDSTLADRIRLVAEMSEALALQKETVETTKKLGALREAGLESSLQCAEELALALQRRIEAEGAAAKVHIAELEQAQKERASEVEQTRKELRTATARVEILERANVELCTQVAEAQAERRADAQRMKSIKVLKSHHVVVEEQEAQRRSSVALRGGRTWAAVVACALALLWSTAAGRVMVDSGSQAKM